MIQQLPRGQQPRWLFAALLLGLLLSILWTGPVARADEARWVGLVETMPVAGLQGAWVVAGRAFTTTESTEFRQDKGAFAVGVCVEVKYVGESAPFSATKMATKSTDDCNSSATPTVSTTPSTTETPDASATPSTTPVPGSEQEAYGRVNRMPISFVGEWVVGGVIYNATAATEFKREEGPFVLGACVKIHYSAATTPFLIREIETTRRFDCGSVTPTSTATVTTTATTTPESKAEVKALVEQMPENGLIGLWMIGGVEYNVFPAARLRQENGPFVVGACVEVEYIQNTTPRVISKLKTERADDCTPDGTPTTVPTVPTVPTDVPGQEFEVYGRVDTLPEGLLGEWVVDGVTYVATESTEFEPDRGDFAVGRCVKIHAFSTTTPATIREIETERGFHCRGNDDDGFQGEGELFGKLQSFPEDLIGEWNIGGLTFMVDASTRLEQRRGAFSVGATVKVHFVVDANNVNLARKIELKFANDQHGHDDDGNGSFEGIEGHAFGTLETLPAGDMIGEWVIGAISYTVTADTRLVSMQGDFAVGAKVRVQYFLKDGQRVARKILTTNEESGADDASHFTLFAYVGKMPPTGYVGEWVLDNIVFVATGQTKFQEDHGELALGAYVKVEYFLLNGRNVIHEVETQVPPGAGDDLTIGQIQSTGAEVAAAGVNGTVWKISGKSYTVTPATDLNDLQSTLTVGATAAVNSYTAADGSQVATQIRGVTLNNQIYLPIAER